MNTAKVIRVFWAAPGDVHDEAIAFFETVSRWNDMHSTALRVLLKPVSWQKDTFPNIGRPQAVINKQALDQSDILVAVFWSRFGTPTGYADSGTEEEIRRSAEAGRTVMIYFCERDIDPALRDPDQAQKLAAFKADMRRAALIHTYQTTEEFRLAFTQHLALAVNHALKDRASGPPGKRPDQSSKAQNIVSFSGGHNVGNIVNQTVVHKYTGKRKPPQSHPEGSIGADLHKRNYVRYLTKRYNEYREADPSYGRNTRFSYGFIYKRIEQEFGNPAFMCPIEAFEAVCDFVQAKIDETIQGKVNRKRGTHNYKSFSAFLAEQETISQRGKKRGKPRA